MIFIASIICLLVTAYALVSCGKVVVVDPPTITETESQNFTIYYNNRGDINKREYKDGATIELLVPQTRLGYSFAGWASDDGALITSPTITNATNAKSMTLTAVWTPMTFAITYEYNGGKEVKNPSSFTIETPTIHLLQPTREGYNFLGWYAKPDFTTTKVTAIEQGVARDIALYAKWSILSYSLSYHLNGSTPNDVVCDTSVSSFDVTTPTITLPTPTRPRHRFQGWYESESFEGAPITTIDCSKRNDSLALFAKWGAPIYSITYELFGGSGDENFVKQYSESSEGNVILSAQIPVKAGFVFNGWYNNSHCLGTKLTIINKRDTDDYALYAAWTDASATNNIEYSPICSTTCLDECDGGCYYTVSRVIDPVCTSYVVGTTYNSLPVKKIEDNVFANLTNTSITLGSSVSNVGAGAFKGVADSNIEIHGNVNVGAFAFQNTTKVQVNFLAQVFTLGDGIFMNANNCAVALPDGIKDIPKDAFNSAYFPTLDIPVSVVNLGENAFANMPKYQGRDGATITLGGNIGFWNSQLFMDSYIKTLVVRPTQPSVPFRVFKELKYPQNAPTKDAHYTKVALSNNQVQGLTQSIYTLVTGGISNPNYLVDFDCHGVNSNPKLLGHYEPGEEKVCIHKTEMLGNAHLLNIPIIATIIHETRHYFQHLCKVGHIKKINSSQIPEASRPSAAVIDSWKKPYITYDESLNNFEAYYHQPVEEDARAAATYLIGYVQIHDNCSQVLPPSIYD